MLNWLLCLILTGVALPAFAANRVTVEQLQQLLTASKAKPDADLAKQLSGLELTERLSSASLARLEATLPGQNARQALVELADASAFLDPPAAEIPSRPTPEIAEQRRMLALTVAYVVKTIPQLPNFFATRDTNRFEDTPQVQAGASFVPYQPLHPIGTTTATVLYRDGKEAIDTGASKKPPPMTQGLTTMGVFGPILSTVLLDAAQNKLAWARWEQGPAGPQAVFTYAVPKEKSHYEVNYCCVAEQSAIVAANLLPFRRVVGYHGEMAIDPDAGTILRLVAEADLKPTDPVVRAGIMVEYGPIEIGGKTYYCPVRSVSAAKAQSLQFDPNFKFPLANQLQPLKTSLNDVAFNQYHVFRADAQVLTEAAAVQPAPPLGTADSTGAVAPISSATPASPAETQTGTASASALSPSGNLPASPPAPAAAPAVPPQPAIPEISVEAATGLPGTPSNFHPSPSQSSFTLHTTARLVDVGLVAYDKKGHPVTDLKPGDIEIYDNGRKQNVSFFSQAGTSPPEAVPGQPATPSTQAAGSQSDAVFSNRRGAAPASGSSDGNLTILLIDGRNLAFSDLTYARGETLRFFQSLAPGQRVALYTMTMTGFQILSEPTADHDLLVAKIRKWMPSAQDLANAQDEERRNRQQIEEVHNVSDLASVNGNTTIEPQAEGSPLDWQLRDFGANPARDALAILVSVARHLAALPGHKNLVWVASDNVLADWSNKSVSVDKGSKFIEPFTLRAQEAMNDAHVSVYPLDASQLEGGAIEASTQHRNVELTPAALDNAAMMGLGGSNSTMEGQDIAVGRDPRPGRLTTQMQQDLHPIQGAIREVADATGGRIFRRSGSIATELDSVVDDGRAAYLLSFTPDQPADNKYHLIAAKVPGRKDITLRFRTGYQYNQEAATLKDRFREAVSKAADVSEITLTANPVPASKGASIKLNIAAIDLDLAQQADRWFDKLDIFLVQRDDAGLHAQVTGQTLGLRLRPESYQRLLRDGVPFEMNVNARPETTSVRIVVVDENSGRMGSVTIPAAAIATKP
jgi:VWFA-related protein